MTMSLRELRRELIRSSSLVDHTICKTCFTTLLKPQQARRLTSTSTATASVEPTEPPIPQPINHESPASRLSSPYNIKAGIVLSRAPLITRTQTPFEKAFYFYQRRLNERLALAFTRSFYYPPESPGETDWKRKIASRQTPGRDIGKYSPHGYNAWNDELRVGDDQSEPDVHVDALLRDAVVEIEEQIEGQEGVVIRRVESERPLSRVTLADEKGDQSSLLRALERTLYLVVRGKEGGWKFPATELDERESLKRAAERLLVEAGGINMNTWIVGNAPVGHYMHAYDGGNVQVQADGEFGDEPLLGEKTFFMKGRIMAGQFSLRKSTLGLQGFKWLSRDELESLLDPAYFGRVRHMLVKL